MVKRYKKENPTSYALGATVVAELINRRPESVRALYISPRSAVELPPIPGVPVIEGDKAFNILSPKENCYVIAEFDKFVSGLSDGRHVVLVNPSNSGNLGTIMRAAAAFGGYDVAIIRPAVDPFDPKTVRASMGAVFDIRFEQFDSFDEYLARHRGREVVPFMLDGAPFAERSFAADKRWSLVFGNEATGLPPEFSRYGGVRIEQSECVDSLNLSVAAAIAMYNVWKRG